MPKKIVEPETALVTVSSESYSALCQETNELRELVDEFFEDGLTENLLNLIKVPAGGGRSWELSESESSPTFDGVVLAVQSTRAYWPTGNAMMGNPPNCSSRDGIVGKGDPGGECKFCEMAQWGTGRNGRGTACNPRKILYVLRPSEVLPVRVALPVTSFAPLTKYKIALLNRRIRPADVVTTFSLAPTTSKDGIKYSVANFTIAGKLDEETATRAKAYAKILTSALGKVAESAAEDAPAPTEIDEDDLPTSWTK